MLSDAKLPASGGTPPSAAGRRAPKRNYRDLAGDDWDDDGAGDHSSPKRIRRRLAGADWEEAESSSPNRKKRGLADGNWWEDGDSWGWNIRKKPRSARKKAGRAALEGSLSDEEGRRGRGKGRGRKKGPKRRRRRRRYESDSSYSPRAVSPRSSITYSDGEDGGSSPKNVRRVCWRVVSIVRLLFLCGCSVLVDLFLMWLLLLDD